MLVRVSTDFKCHTWLIECRWCGASLSPDLLGSCCVHSLLYLPIAAMAGVECAAIALEESHTCKIVSVTDKYVGMSHFPKFINTITKQ